MEYKCSSSWASTDDILTAIIFYSPSEIQTLNHFQKPPFIIYIKGQQQEISAQTEPDYAVKKLKNYIFYNV